MDIYVFDMPENLFFDALLQFPFWLAVIVVIQTSIIFIFWDALKWLSHIINVRWRGLMLKYESRFYFTVILVFMIYVPARAFYDYVHISVRTIELKSGTIPEALNNFTITFIADVQADRYNNTWRLSKFMNLVNKTNPDLVLVGGDVITFGNRYINLSAKSMALIKSKLGVYACIGDHDNWAYHEDVDRSIKEVTQALAAKNIKMLNDSLVIFNVGNAKLAVAFITNTYVEVVDKKTLSTTLDKGEDADFRILLAHQPRNYILSQAIAKNYNLYLCGHTHGGQLTFFFPFINLSPTLVETKYVKGDYRFGNLLFVISKGLGMSLAPLRYNSTPEIIVIKLIKTSR
jgi:predicted MPP superfamily phosphohydrolase